MRSKTHRLSGRTLRGARCMAYPNINTVVTGSTQWTRTRSGPTCQANISGSDGATNISTYSRSITSTNTPNFFRLKPKDYPFHSYSKTIVRRSDPPGVLAFTQYATGQPCTYRWDYQGYNVYKMDGGYPPLNVADDPTQKVYSKLLNKISLKKTDLGVTIAELGKTAKFVQETATRLAGAIKALRKLDILYFTRALGVTPSLKQRRRWNKRLRRYELHLPDKRADRRSRVEAFAAQTWLEYSYAWKPLLNDVYTSAQATASLAIDWQYLAHTVSASAESSKTAFIRGLDSTGRFKRSVNTTSQWSVKATIHYKIDPNAINATNVFGLNNPLTIAWELVPFSFVADWFLPIGDALSNLTATSGLTFFGGFVSSKRSTTQVVTYASNGNFSQSGGFTFKDVVLNMSQTTDEFVFERKPLSSFPAPSFPEFKNPVSFSHATSAIALLSSLFRK
ncbi:MAG: maturation protein [Sanya fiers-like virus 11]|nr:MAG: maturation protein [Sanya fiers-like virus 11]UUW21246.1 MAG: maturation protein [Sanya fiers-like virus 11]